MVRFYSYGSRLYRFLVSVGNSAWLIDYENPGKPIELSVEVLNTIPLAPVPDDYLDESAVTEKRNATMEKRLALIEPLLYNSIFITDESIRRRSIENIAKTNGISARTVYRFYFGYLAKGKKGLLPEARVRQTGKESDRINRIVRQAINEFYYSPKRPSVRAAYELMLMKYFRTEDGILLESRPSYNQFRYLLQETRDVSKEIIAREGLGEFKKNFRPLLGNGDSGVENIGLYEIDATVADIYIVSRYDRKPIGRPILYVAVDIASRLIAGIHVGLEENAEAVMCCLGNAAADKVEFCEKYGIHIQKEQWPSKGMPGYICTDRGTDFISNRCKELCMLFGVEITSLPAYRPDLKGYVERAIGCIQDRYKPQLRGCGVVDKVKAERAAPNFALQATLDLDEFTKVIIECVLYYNAFYLLNDYLRLPEMIRDHVMPVAADIWCWHKENGRDNTIEVDEESLRLMLLPRSTGRVTRQGIEFNDLFYYNQELSGEFVRAGIRGTYEVTVAYEPNDNGHIYLVDNGVYHLLQMTQASKQYGRMSHQEIQLLRKGENQVRKEIADRQVTGAVACVSAIDSIIDGAKKKKTVITGEDTSQETMSERREKEKSDD